MKILLDAQLPRALKGQPEPMGCDILHTLDLPEGNRSSGITISSIADHDRRVVFSKDADRDHWQHQQQGAVCPAAWCVAGFDQAV
jgi:predicted nuclease of predicted toxin-antitoxin system